MVLVVTFTDLILFLWSAFPKHLSMFAQMKPFFETIPQIFFHPRSIQKHTHKSGELWQCLSNELSVNGIEFLCYGESQEILRRKTLCVSHKKRKRCFKAKPPIT